MIWEKILRFHTILVDRILASTEFDYSYYPNHSPDYFCTLLRPRRHHVLAITETNKQIRLETLPILYSNKFMFSKPIAFDAFFKRIPLDMRDAFKNIELGFVGTEHETEILQLIREKWRLTRCSVVRSRVVWMNKSHIYDRRSLKRWIEGEKVDCKIL